MALPNMIATASFSQEVADKLSELCEISLQETNSFSGWHRLQPFPLLNIWFLGKSHLLGFLYFSSPRTCDSRINFFPPGRVLAGPGFQDFQSEKHAFSSESCNNPITLAELSFVEAIITFLLEISRGCWFFYFLDHYCKKQSSGFALLTGFL